MFIFLTKIKNSGNGQLVVNTDQIVTMAHLSTGGTTLYLSDDSYEEVKESITEIIGKMQ